MAPLRTRPEHLRAIDWISWHGNRSIRNPVLKAAAELIFLPLGIQSEVTISMAECGFGVMTPVYFFQPKWMPSLATGRPNFNRLAEGGTHVQVALSSELNLEIVLSVNRAPDDLYLGALARDLEAGLAGTLQAELDEACLYFREFLGAIFRSLADPDTPASWFIEFWRDPASYPAFLAQKLSNGYEPRGLPRLHGFVD